jgi:hypothetical protein
MFLDDGIAVLLCPHDFHMDELGNFQSQLVAIFGNISLYRNVYEYTNECPVATYAIRELGAQIGV